MDVKNVVCDEHEREITELKAEVLRLKNEIIDLKIERRNREMEEWRGEARIRETLHEVGAAFGRLISPFRK